MAEELAVAVVGAGPFGLSVAAHLADRRTRVFGAPMQTWRTRMPPDMVLRSAWEETSLSAPGRAGTIDRWLEESGETREEPIPLQKFLRYSEWFRQRFVRDHDESDVASLERVEGGFRLRTTAGAEFDAAAVVLAVGVTPFGHAPPPFDAFVGNGVRHAIDAYDFDDARGRSIVVVGGGQNAIESAALACRAGASVEIVVRSHLRWFADREPHHERGPVGRRLYRLAYPAVGYGPPPLNRLVLHPDVFAALPRGLRVRLTRRLLRPGGAPWLRGEVAAATVSEERSVVSLAREEGRLRLRLDDGSVRSADEVILATGYRFSLDRLPFLAPSVRERVRVEDGWPTLDRNFRSTDPQLFFVGYAAEYRFGPLSRFVLGADFTARRVHQALAQR